MNTDLTTSDLDPIIEAAQLRKVSVYRYFAQAMIDSGRTPKMSQFRIAFRSVYGSDFERGLMVEYVESIGGKCCGRCGGTGQYSYNALDGTRCFKCGGAGYIMPKQKKAKA